MFFRQQHNSLIQRIPWVGNPFGHQVDDSVKNAPKVTTQRIAQILHLWFGAHYGEGTAVRVYEYMVLWPAVFYVFFFAESGFYTELGNSLASTSAATFYGICSGSIGLGYTYVQDLEGLGFGPGNRR